ncbi:MAG TPA: Rrf2 family transcriptional regulator [Candidatus Deferrimicrobiaceae bacterium]
MKITTKGRYAVMAMVGLAAFSRGNPIPLKEIAAQEGIPIAYLQQLFVKLRKRNLVKSVRGPGGGFILARHPSEITIGEVIRTAEGKPPAVGCRKSGRTCGMIGRCKTQGMWEALEGRMDEFLDSISVNDLFPEKGTQSKEAAL